VSSGLRFGFEPFELHPAKRRLIVGGEPVAMSDRHLDVLTLLVARAGQIVSKDDLIQAGWKDVAVGDNSLEQAISTLRRQLAVHAATIPFIETVPRRGYRFVANVTRLASRETDAGLDALLAPHRAFIEGRAALETLEADRVAGARLVFEDVLERAPDLAAAHIGLANACVMQFEMTRADAEPDAAALAVAVQHAREACRLDLQSAEAWATLGFTLDRMGQNLDARAALKRATTLEPDNWRHEFRLSFVSWGEERLRAAHRALALLPDFPLARWLAATVHVARQALPLAEREITAGLAHAETSVPRFGAVALHWMLGLIRLVSGDEEAALQEFDRELALEDSKHLYARECAANTWYAIGALRLRQGRTADAQVAFENAIARVAAHPLAHVGLAAISPEAAIAPLGATVAAAIQRGRVAAIDIALSRAAQLTLEGNHIEAGRWIDEALSAAPAGNAAWFLALEPLLNVSAHPECWLRPLARLRNRAA
jgi:DNA-binding winged helix-turn-helix (wHTH) protein/Tfp pilus assembly protein PilF